MLQSLFKKILFHFIDELSSEAKGSQSVNTIYKKGSKILGHNTDIAGFELGLRHIIMISRTKSFNSRSRRGCAINNIRA